METIFNSSNCIIHEGSGELKPIIMHTIQFIIGSFLLIATFVQSCEFQPNHPAFKAVQYLTTCTQPVVGVSAYAFSRVETNSYIKLLLNQFLSTYTEWKWIEQDGIVIATVESSSFAAWLNIILTCIQFYCAIIPCTRNGFYWDERCFTGWFESFGLTNILMLLFLMPNKYEVWPKRVDGNFSYYSRMINIVLMSIQGLFIAVIYAICVIPYYIPGLCIVVIFIRVFITTPYVLCCGDCSRDESIILIGSRDNFVQRNKCRKIFKTCLVIIGIFCGITGFIWAIFASGKLYSGDMNYLYSALCVWKERSWSAYIGYNFAMLRAWISSF